MVKFAYQFLLIILGNILLFYYMAIKREVIVDDIVFYLFCLNMLCAYFTKENKSFAPFRVINYRVASSTSESVKSFSTNVDDKEEVAQVLNNFQEKRNYVGMSFFIVSLLYLGYGLYSYLTM